MSFCWLVIGFWQEGANLGKEGIRKGLSWSKERERAAMCLFRSFKSQTIREGRGQDGESSDAHGGVSQADKALK